MPDSRAPQWSDWYSRNHAAPTSPQGRRLRNRPQHVPAVEHQRVGEKTSADRRRGFAAEQRQAKAEGGSDGRQAAPLLPPQTMQRPGHAPKNVMISRLRLAIHATVTACSSRSAKNNVASPAAAAADHVIARLASRSWASTPTRIEFVSGMRKQAAKEKPDGHNRPGKPQRALGVHQPLLPRPERVVHPVRNGRQGTEEVHAVAGSGPPRSQPGRHVGAVAIGVPLLNVNRSRMRLPFPNSTSPRRIIPWKKSSS